MKSFYCCDVFQNVSFMFQGFFVAFIYCFCNGEVVLTSKNHAYSPCCFLSLNLQLLFFIFCCQVQTEVKKAWLRRSLTQDIKHKSRMTSSAGGGSCYYGGVMSHTTAHSVSLSVVTPRSLSGGAAGGSGGSAGGGSGLRPPHHNSVCLQNNLPACTAAEPETGRWQQEPTLQMESGGFNRHVRASLGSPLSKNSEAAPARSLGGEEPDGFFSLKELETVL